MNRRPSVPNVQERKEVEVPLPPDGWNITYDITGSDEINSNYDVSAIGRNAYLFVPLVMETMSKNQSLKDQESFAALATEYWPWQ